MKKQNRLSPHSLFLAFLVWCVISPAFAGFVDCLSVNGIYSRRLSGDLGSENGFGASTLLEFQAIPSLSLGLGLDYLNYIGSQPAGRNQVGSINLVSRLQFRANDVWTPFLMVGGGFNARTDFGEWHSWPWHCHLLGGLGTWYFLSHTTALDVGAVYNFYDATGNPLQCINARLGLSFFFGEAMENAVSTAQAVIDLPGTSSSIAVAQTPAPRSQTEEQAVGVPISKQEMGAPAAKPQAEQQDLGVPISKQETGAPPLAVSAASAVAEEKVPPPASDVKTESPDLSPDSSGVASAKPEASTEPEPTPAVMAAVSKSEETIAQPPEAEKEQPTPEPTNAPEAAFALQYAEIVILKGDSVWDTAARREVYYDPELYPLIVDANREALKRRYVFEEPMTLRFPTNATEEMKQKARRNAWTREYQNLGGRRLIPWAYQRWLMNHGLPNTFQEK